MNKRRTAVHEAAHAVIGRVLDMVCGQVTITPDDDSSGHAICADPWTTYGQWDQRGKYRDIHTVFRGRIITFMAGAEAESEIIGQCRGGDGDDRYQIELMAESNDCNLSVEQWARYEPRMRRQCRRLVRRHRTAIERVADILLSRETIPAPEIDALMGRGDDR